LYNLTPPLLWFRHKEQRHQKLKSKNTTGTHHIDSSLFEPLKSDCKSWGRENAHHLLSKFVKKSLDIHFPCLGSTISAAASTNLTGSCPFLTFQTLNPSFYPGSAILKSGGLGPEHHILPYVRGPEVINVERVEPKFCCEETFIWQAEACSDWFLPYYVAAEIHKGSGCTGLHLCFEELSRRISVVSELSGYIGFGTQVGRL
jgi:hypothetical protein